MKITTINFITIISLILFVAAETTLIYRYLFDHFFNLSVAGFGAKITVALISLLISTFPLYILYLRSQERNRRNLILELKENGLTFVNIPDNLKDLFIDSLRAFENYVKLTGYEIKFSFDNTEKDRLGFRFTVTENPNNVSTEEIRADIKEFLEKIQRGEEIKDIPVLINEIEHIKVLTILNNKLSTIRHNAYLEKNLNSGIEHIVKKVIEDKGFTQSINIYNHMGENKEIKATNSNVNMGNNNLIEDNSINIYHSFNEKKTIIERIDQSITHINNEASLSQEDKEELKRHLGNIKEEIEEEAQPNPSKLKKAWDKIKKIVEAVSLSKELLKNLKEIAGIFGVEFPS